MQRVYDNEADELRFIATEALTVKVAEQKVLREKRKEEAVVHVNWVVHKYMTPIAKEGKFSFAGYLLPENWDPDLFEEALLERKYHVKRRARTFSVSWAKEKYE